MFELTIRENEADQRLDKVLRKYLRNAPESFLYKMLRKRNITLNGGKSAGNERLKKGDKVQFYFSQETFDKMRGSAAPIKTETSASQKAPKIKVLYEDSDVLLFVKPVGMLSQKAEPTDYSANDWVLSYAVSRGIISDSEFETFRPSVCNRLDRNTGGIMAAGLSYQGLKYLSELFRERTLEKYYYALVLGKPEDHADISGYLVKNRNTNKVMVTDRSDIPGAEKIHTEYELLKYDEEKQISLLKVHLYTGKSHQIRAHLASIGHPILGDPKYGNPTYNLYYHKNKQCLLSYHLSFPECALKGVSGKTFEIPVPKNWPVRLEE